MTLTLTKTLLGSTGVPMPSLVLIGPAVRPAIGNIQTDKQTDTHIAFYYVDTTKQLNINKYRSAV